MASIGVQVEQGGCPVPWLPETMAARPSAWGEEGHRIGWIALNSLVSAVRTVLWPKYF